MNLRNELIRQLTQVASDMHKQIAINASAAADKLHREAGRAARQQHNCKVFSRGFEFLSLNADGERDEEVVDYCERGEMTGNMIADQIESVRSSGSAYLAIGYGVDSAENQKWYDAGDYEPMFDWVDLDNIDVRT